MVVFGAVLGLPLSNACVETRLTLQGYSGEYLAATRVLSVRCILLARLVSYMQALTGRV